MRAKISSHPIRLQDPSIIDILGRKQPVSSRFFSLMLRDSNHGKTTCKTITTVMFGEACSITPSMPRLTKGEFGWCGGSMAAMQVIRKLMKD